MDNTLSHMSVASGNSNSVLFFGTSSAPLQFIKDSTISIATVISAPPNCSIDKHCSHIWKTSTIPMASYNLKEQPCNYDKLTFHTELCKCCGIVVMKHRINKNSIKYQVKTLTPKKSNLFFKLILFDNSYFIPKSIIVN